MFFTIGNVFATINNSLTKKYVDPYNPLDLPPNTVRVRTNDGQRPLISFHTSYETATLVDGTTDVFDVYKSGSSFDYLLEGSYNVVEVLGANTTGIRSMFSMFHATEITTVPLFDTSSVTNMSYMFTSCPLTSVPLFNTSSVTNMEAMFQQCSSLEYVPLFDTSNVTNMQSMFLGCSVLANVPSFDTSRVTTMNRMFYVCSSLTLVPLFNTSRVTDMEDMFFDCRSLTSVPLFDTSSVIYMSSMFYECGSVQSGALALYQQASTQTNPPTNHSHTFYNCGINTTQGVAELAQIPSDWK